MPYEPKREPQDPCPVEEVLHLISGKWKARVMLLLFLAPRRFAELRKGLPGVSQQVLSTQLQALVADGLVDCARHENSSGGWSVYALTDSGKALLPLLEKIADFGMERLHSRGLNWTTPTL